MDVRYGFKMNVKRCKCRDVDAIGMFEMLNVVAHRQSVRAAAKEVHAVHHALHHAVHR